MKTNMSLGRSISETIFCSHVQDSVLWYLYMYIFVLWQSCAISACGNFALLGTADGWIERFNLQSGISRGSYLDASERSCAHNGEVVGIACDATNTLVISAGYHGDIKVC